MIPKPLETESLHDDENDNSLKTERIRRAHEDRSKERRKTIQKRERIQQQVQAAPTNPESLVRGRIVQTEGAFFVARLSEGTEIRVKSYKGTQTENPSATLVAVGDIVKIQFKPEDVSIVEMVEKRKTLLARKAAGRRDAFQQVIVSNIDTLVIVASFGEPPLRSGIIDRYIVAGLDGGLEIAIVINKIDLANEEEYDEILYFRDVYSELGYPVFLVSATRDEGLEGLRTHLTGKTSVLAGHSGVGKSSIINSLFGREVGRTGVLSKKYKRGAHTTTSSILMPVEGVENTYIVDTPGVREFSNFELDPQNLKFFFVEFLPLQERCRITNCTHIHEPGCAVIEAMEADTIAIERYTSYTKLFEEARSAERRKVDKE